MPRRSPIRDALRVLPAAVLPAIACSGCAMLGAMFDEHPLGGIAFVVVAVAALGFLASRGARRR
ncbi:MAG TPA: hypothetical protein VIG68_08285 [Lysobacter sp.]